MLSATATVTETIDISVPVNTPTATMTSTDVLVIGATATATATFNPNVNLHITTTNTILVIVRVRHMDALTGVETISVGTLLPSNNPDHLELVNPGDVVEVLSQNQTSMEIITVVASWDGGSYVGNSEPDGLVNSARLPAR
ncbi:MAG: hypothetical protein WC933_02895 [Candidatus Paceibacterota bacterium]